MSNYNKYPIEKHCFEKNLTVINVLNYARHFVLKIYETICSDVQTDYLNTHRLFRVPKKLNMKYEYYYSVQLSK